ncbi:hypothetical protein ACN9MZ_00535 [Pseudoduganella sp. S-14]|uniref:hypothetical protein n=1 Tax=Pseudoduganella sp. S-14 TaxID=3404065 RepID=UPI003CE78D3B
MSLPFGPRRGKAWLAAIVLAHAALFLCWRGMPYVRQANVQRESELVYLQAPTRPAKRPPAVAAPSVPAVSPASRRSAPPPPMVNTATAPAASDTAPPVAEAVTVPATTSEDPFAKPVPPAESLLEKNRKLAAGVDRQLRKESLNKFATIVREESPLARQLARAYNGQVVLEQVSDLGDGRTMKRFRAGGKEWCEVVNLVGAAGQDPFRDGNKVQVKTCP